MRTMAQKRKKKTAVVQCAGGCRAGSPAQGENGKGSESRLYENCADAAQKLSQDSSLCRWGCLGLGSCVEVCRLGAVFINSGGTAEIDRSRCVGCGLCVKACPRHLIRLTEPEYHIYPACVSEALGAQTKKECAAGCIACGICVKNCPADAIQIEENHAVIDEEKCISCGMCAVKCPRGIIRDYDGIFAAGSPQRKE